MGTSYRYTEQIQGPGDIMKFEVSRKNVIIYIYDPGGFLSCFYGIRYAAGILNIQQVVQVFNKQELYLEGKESIAVKALPVMYLTQVERGCEVYDPP